MKFINAIGVEMEGGWYEPIRNLKSDGSINGLSTQCEQIGEAVSDPCTNLRDVVRFIRSKHPDEVNRTCGLHVHYSFRKPLYYGALMEESFQPFFFDRMEKWIFKFHPRNAHLQDRLYGRNQYCRREWRALSQVHPRELGSAARYTAWNFAYSKYGTAECRLLPMFENVEDSVAAVRQVTLLVNQWLRRGVPDNTKPIEETIETDPSQQPELTGIDRVADTIVVREENFREKFICV
jgi:hypothetical protein